MVRFFTVGLFFLAALSARAQEGDAERVLEKFQKAQPDADEMAIYQHDWTANLKQALVRAKKEKRPIFFIGNTNITGPSNFYSGHC